MDDASKTRARELNNQMLRPCCAVVVCPPYRNFWLRAWFRVTIFFFREIYRICFARRGDFCEWSDCNFLQLILFANSCVLLFSAGISLTPFEKATAVRKLARDSIASKRSITPSILACFKKRWPTNRLFMPTALH